MKIIALSAGLCLSYVVDDAGAIIRRHDVADSEYIALGAQSQFQSVGTVGFRAPNGFPGATGVLIDSEWVLTAAHRINQDPGFEWAFQIDGAIYDSDQIIYHPDFNGSVNGSGGADLALVHLSDPVLSVTPATFAEQPMEFGSEFTIAGYGGIGDGLGNNWTFTNVLHAATNLWDRQQVSSEYFISKFDHPDTGRDPTAMEGSATNGDAGAGLFAQVNGEWGLHGIYSYSLDRNLNGLFGDYGDENRHTKLEAYMPWIRGIVPAPGSVGVFGICGVCVMRRRRSC